MKRIRDVLIIVVLGSVVIWFVVGFIDRVHDASVNNSMVVHNAMIACLNDRMDCQFSSIESAQRYLDSPEHLAKSESTGGRRGKIPKDDKCLERLQQMHKAS